VDRGVIIDVETTGLDAATDSIIEIGVVEFVRGASADQVQVAAVYSGLQDPGRPLTAEIVKLTGLTDEMLAGRRIEWGFVTKILADASIVIAHNAEFDTRFLLRVPELQSLNLHWACSLRHIDWDSKGFKTKKLTYLAADAGFVNPFPHRAVFDCCTTLRLVTPYLDELVRNSYQREIRILAAQAPFESKDLLKARGYVWDAQQRVWWRVLGEDRMQEEREFLASQVYRPGCDGHIEQVLPPLGQMESNLIEG
jgi:DNA polymerase-3 subunit epsilon